MVSVSDITSQLVIRQTVPCIRGLASGPLTPAAQCACRYPAGRQQPHPAQHPVISISQPKSTFHAKLPQRACTYHSQILKRPGLLNILQRLLQIPQLHIDPPFRILRTLDRLFLKRFNRLDLPAHIIRRRFPLLEVVLDLVDHALVLEDASVVREVDRLRLVRQHLHFAARVVVAFLERLQGRGRLAFEAEGGAYFAPVDFESCAALSFGGRRSVRD